SQYDNGKWNQVERSAAEKQGLDNAATARERGQTQAERFNSRDAAARSGTARGEGRSGTPRPSTSPAGTPSGGGSRGGARPSGGGGRRR
ncbi:MAG TPA: hypothetical protein VLJ38_02215, partial [Polyangiaceae bacterium]|nr:hypothetical protein [Polyangiaceae bacterium]